MPPLAWWAARLSNSAVITELWLFVEMRASASGCSAPREQDAAEGVLGRHGARHGGESLDLGDRAETILGTQRERVKLLRLSPPRPSRMEQRRGYAAARTAAGAGSPRAMNLFTSFVLRTGLAVMKRSLARRYW